MILSVYHHSKKQIRWLTKSPHLTFWHIQNVQKSCNELSSLLVHSPSNNCHNSQYPTTNNTRLNLLQLRISLRLDITTLNSKSLLIKHYRAETWPELTKNLRYQCILGSFAMAALCLARTCRRRSLVIMWGRKFRPLRHVKFRIATYARTYFANIFITPDLARLIKVIEINLLSRKCTKNCPAKMRILLQNLFKFMQ